MAEQRKINFSIAEGEPFFSHELSINFNPTQFILDFKCITPRVDARTRDGSTILSLKHNVVMLEPYHAKQVMTVLQEMIGKYEQRFGEIKLPRPLEQLEKEAKKADKKKGKIKEVSEEGKAGKFPKYLG